jgi:hypothetical protein
LIGSSGGGIALAEFLRVPDTDGAGSSTQAVEATPTPSGDAEEIFEGSTGRSPSESPALLLVDDAAVPTSRIRWETGGGWVAHEGARPYAHDAERALLGDNVSCYVAVGGVRLSKVAGHPLGAIVRTGFYKVDAGLPFFAGLGPGGEVEVELRGVRFNQAVDVYAASIVQHVKYDPAALESCNMPPDAREMFNMQSDTDALNERTRPGVDARLGALGPSGVGRADVRVEEDGSVTLTCRFPYGLLRNLRDPWESELPGTFLEPVHFHVEFEALPAGVPPLDFDALRRERDEKLRQQGIDPEKERWPGPQGSETQD